MENSQRVDLLAGNDNRERLVTYLNVIARWTQSQTDHPDGVCNMPVLVRGSDGSGPTLGDNPFSFAYPLGYVLLRTDAEPLTQTKLDNDNNGPVVAARWVRKWESLFASTW